MRIIFIIFSLLISFSGISQTVIPYTKSAVDGVYVKDTLLILTGDANGYRSILTLKNLKGVTITVNSPLTVNGTGGYAIQFQNCERVKLDGKDLLKIKGGTNTVIVYNLTKSIEITGCEISGSTFAGIMVKTDPTSDPATHRGSFVMDYVKINNNYIHDVSGEGIYCGNSFYVRGHDIGGGVYILPHLINNVEIYDNVIERSGWESIQVGCGVKTIIARNKITSFGLRKTDGQANGIQVGEGTSAEVTGNIIKDGAYDKGNGIILLGKDKCTLSGNEITNAGTGIFADDRTPESDFYITGNTITNSRKYGLDFYTKVSYGTNTISGSAVKDINLYEGGLSSINLDLIPEPSTTQQAIFNAPEGMKLNVVSEDSRVIINVVPK